MIAAEAHDELQIIAHYPAEKRYILAILQDVQKKDHYLPREALEMTARHVRVPLSSVYSIATFYKAFSLVPKGRNIVKACDGTACHIKGSLVIINEIYKCLGIKPGETTPDREFSLETVNCMGACALAPVMVVNDQIYAKVTPAKLRQILEGYRERSGEALASK